MPLTLNIEDPRFVKQLDGLNHHHQFIHELASVILMADDGFESVWSLANRVYDRHCSPKAGLRNRRRVDPPARTAISA
jgi:hypothetical protein